MSKKDSKRIRLYKELSGKKSLIGVAARRTENEMGLSPDTRFFLYGFIPAVVEFAGWVLDKAVESGRKRLYFLSRDGYQIYLAACKIAELKKLPVECRYLHVSRYAMRVPAYHLDLHGSLDRICSGGMKVTLEIILKRGGLTEEEAREVADSIGRKDGYRKLLNQKQIANLKMILGHEPLFLKYVEAHSREAYENAMGYLRQEGLLSEDSYAIVDSGWVGTFQQSLQSLIHSSAPHIHIEGYYFGLYELPPEADACDYHGWYFTPEEGLKRKVYFCNSLFEALCSADEGMTVGYFRQGGRYLPVLDPAGNPNGEKIRRNLAVLECFLKNYGEVYALTNKVPFSANTYFRKIKKLQRGSAGSTEDRIGSVKKRFTLLMAKPSAVEMRSFGALLFSDDVLTGNYQELAARLTKEEIRNLYILPRLCILTGLRRGILRESAWVEGSIVRCGMCGGRGKAKARKSGAGEAMESGQEIHGTESVDSLYIRKSLRRIRRYKYLAYGRKQLKAHLHQQKNGKEAIV